MIKPMNVVDYEQGIEAASVEADSLSSSMHNLRLSNYPLSPGQFLGQSGCVSPYMAFALNDQSRNRIQEVVVQNSTGALLSPYIQYQFPGWLNLPLSPSPSTASDHTNFSSLYTASSPRKPNGFDIPDTNTQNPGCFIDQQHYPFDFPTSILDKERVLTMAKDIVGSSFLQGLLKPGSYMTQTISDSMVCYSYQLIIHPVGSRFFMKLFEACDVHQKTRILSFLIEDEETLVSASCHWIGTRVIQGLIKTVKEIPMIAGLPRVLAPHVKFLAKNQTGRHVIQKCFQYLDECKNMPLCNEMINHWLPLAIDNQGCLALNECMDNMGFVYKNHLVLCISYHAVFLSQKKYGNFVLQNVLKMKNGIYEKIIVMELESLYERLSTTRNGSYLVEQCLRTPYLHHVVKELLDSSRLLRIAQHPYGNYVIQTALQETKEREAPMYQKLSKKLYQGLNHLQSNPYGRMINNMLKEWQNEERLSGILDEPRSL